MHICHVVLGTVLRTRFQGTIIMQIRYYLSIVLENQYYLSIVLEDCIFNDTDLPLISKYCTGLILGCVVGPRSHEYLMSLEIGI